MLADKKITVDEYVASGTPQAKKVDQWRNTQRKNRGYWYGSRHEGKFFLSDAVVDAVDALPFDAEMKMNLVKTYVDGERFGLDDAGWVRWCKQQTAEQYWYYDTNWVAEEVSSRTKLQYNYGYKDLVSRMVHHTRPVGLTEFKNLIRLAFFLDSEYEGSFAEYLAEDMDSNEETYVTELRFPDNHKTELLDYAASRNVATFDHRVTKKVRALLQEQDRDFWYATIVDAKWKEYKKGHSYEHAAAFIKQIKSGKNTRVRSAEEISALFTQMVLKALAEGYGTIPDAKYNHFASVVLGTQSYLSARRFDVAKEEFASIYDSVKNLDLSMTQTVGLVHALVEHKYWMRGNRNNAIFLLEEMLTGDSKEDFAKILGDCVFNDYDDLPTETEWRNAMSEELGFMPTEIFLSVTAHPKTERKMKANPSDTVFSWRRSIGMDS